MPNQSVSQSVSQIAEKGRIICVGQWDRMFILKPGLRHLNLV